MSKLEGTFVLKSHKKHSVVYTDVNEGVDVQIANAFYINRTALRKLSVDNEVPQKIKITIEEVQ